ncbi:HNH endonuclease [Paraburkholderia fungorum]|nr:SAVED domain-containing protein [Paraburkholderia fungorum]
MEAFLTNSKRLLNEFLENFLRRRFTPPLRLQSDFLNRMFTDCAFCKITISCVLLHYILNMTQPVASMGDLENTVSEADSNAEIIRGISDGELALALRGILRRGNPVVLIADKQRVAVASQREQNAEWRFEASGDFGDQSRAVVEGAMKNFKWLEVDSLETGLDAAASATVYRKGDVSRWTERRDILTGFKRPKAQDRGRTGEISADTRKRVGAEAGWHCQFEGCGENLWLDANTDTLGNFSYFAHIIASSVDGPRGHAKLSGRLFDTAENVMLLCDKCHRLIDRVSPDEYSVDTLNGMRAANVEQVASLFRSLRFPSSYMIVVGGNILNQSVVFDQRRAEEAMRAAKLRPAGGKPFWFAYNGNEMGDGSSPHFWETQFDQWARMDIPALRARLTGATYGGAQAEVVSVFPLHLMSVLVLAGHLIGEARSVQVFQFERNSVGDNTQGDQWAWPKDAKRPDPSKYSVVVHREPTNGETEALLLVSLTDRVPRGELPAEFYEDGAWKMPVVEVVVPTPSRSVIGHPYDLELVGKAFDDALQSLQEKWRVSRIHCVPIAPTAACIRLGQKLQSRHQSRIAFYERARTTDGTRGQFKPTIEIASSYVKNVATDREVPLT